MRSNTILPNNPGHHSAWAKARWHYGKAMEIEGGQKSEVRGQRKESKELKRMKKEIRDYVWRFYPDEGFVGQVMAP